MQIVIFGVGKLYSMCSKLLYSDIEMEIMDVWDNNENIGSIDGRTVNRPNNNFLKSDVYIVVLTNYYNEMMEQCVALGYKEDKIVCVNKLFEVFVKKYYENYMPDNISEEEERALDRIKNVGLETYNADLQDKYEIDDVQCEWDECNSSWYVLHEGRKMYMPNNYDMVISKEYYNNRRREQDFNNTHNYFKWCKNDWYDVIIDAGCSEGYFALSMADRCDELYVIEPDNEWFEKYKYTFMEEKYNLINKYLGAENTEKSVTIDAITKKYHHKKILVKMDIEGGEEQAIKGARMLFYSDNEVTFIVCGYHHANAEEVIKKMFNEFNMEVFSSDKNMFFAPSNEMNTLNGTDNVRKNGICNYRMRCGVIAAYKSVGL